MNLPVKNSDAKYSLIIRAESALPGGEAACFKKQSLTVNTDAKRFLFQKDLTRRWRPAAMAFILPVYQQMLHPARAFNGQARAG